MVSKQQIIEYINDWLEGAEYLNVAVRPYSAYTSCKRSNEPVEFKFLPTVLNLINALPDEFLRIAEYLSVTLQPDSFHIYGATDNYEFTIAPPDDFELGGKEIPAEFREFCETFNSETEFVIRFYER